MAWTSVKKGTQELWNLCNQNDILPDNNSRFDTWTFKTGVIVYDSRSGVALDTRRFLLISPELSNKYLQRLVTLMRQEELTCGFKVQEAYACDVVYVIDPYRDFFSDQDLFPLVQANTKIEHVEGSEPTALVQNLKALLSQ